MIVRVKQVLWIAVALALAFAIFRAFQPVAVIVDAATIERGRLRITVDDDGRTRVRERYTISAPIQGRLLRTSLDPGDVVQAGETVVAEFAPTAPDLLDARSRDAADARLRRAEAAEQETDARREQAAAAAAFAAVELRRVRDLDRRGIDSRARREVAERDERSAREALRAADFAAQVARYEVEIARASLREPDPDADAAGAVHAEHRDPPAAGRLRLRSPIDGVVLHVFEESARTLPAGTPILEVGNTRALEIVADYLTQDAVLVRPEMPVIVTGWGGERGAGPRAELRGRVRVVEPGGFTRISALGVEEQRVNVIVDPVGEPDAWSSFGDGYHVELRIVLSERDDVPIVPTGALFRDGDRWSVYVVEGGRARRRALRIGGDNGLEAEIVDGVDVGARVVLYPSDLIGEGTRVEVR